MNLDLLKEKVQAYPVAAASSVVILLALALGYFHSEEEAVLLAEREAKSKELQEVLLNESNARNLKRDIDRAKLLNERIMSMALDFESTISAQAFFADFIQNSPIKSEGLPVQESPPSLMPFNPFAFSSYKLHAIADFGSLVSFLASFDTHPEKALVVSRVQISEADLVKKGGDMLVADIVFRLWGRKGDLKPLAVVPDKTVVAARSRGERLDVAEKFISPPVVDYVIASNPFGSDLKPQGDKIGAANSIQRLEAALVKMKFTIEPFLGSSAVKFPESSPKRVNSEFDVKVDGGLERVRIIAIAKDSFTVQTRSGNKLKVSQKQ